MITAGITRANINISKYLFIIDDGIVGFVVVGDDDDDVDSVVVLAAFWILNPNMNDDVPIRKETIVRTFCVRPGIRAIGEPWLVSCWFCCCCCCCWSCCFCALTIFVSVYTNDSETSTVANVNKIDNSMIKAPGDLLE
jgi:hypothetical protein